MEYSSIVSGKFIDRPNRFVALIDIDGEIERCHVKNTGRCKELLTEGAQVFLEPSRNTGRATKYSLVAVKKGSRLINMDSQAPNKAVFEALAQGRIFDGITYVKPEYRYGKSRFDFYAQADKDKWLIEVKGVTLEMGGAAYFPDAPTQRGLKHVNELLEAIPQGFKTCVIFVIQMENVSFFAPNDITHPQFGQALKAAEAGGVRLLAYDCKVSEDTMTLGNTVEVRL